MIDDVSILFPKTQSGIEDGPDQFNKSDGEYTPFDVSFDREMPGVSALAPAWMAEVER
jgi:hypothetical protein